MSNTGPHNSASFQRYDSEFYHIKNFIFGSVHQSCTGVCLLLAINSFSSIMLCLVFKSISFIYKALNGHEDSSFKFNNIISNMFVFWRIQSAFEKVYSLSKITRICLICSIQPQRVCATLVIHTLLVLYFTSQSTFFFSRFGRFS